VTAAPTSTGAHPRTLVDLDELLFAPRAWFAIDAHNRRTAGVVVPTLTAGLQLLGRGDVAAIVGHLRDEIRVVDVDLDDERGPAAAEAIVSWCAREGLWSLVRPSGGAPGRTHVFIAHEGRLPALRALVEDLRRGLHAPKTSIDLRTAVRPLSSPHRNGQFTRPHGRLSETLTALRRHSWAQKAPRRALRGPQSAPSTGTALVPARRRARSALPAAWAAYLESGTPPPIGGHDQTRSAVELVATAELLRAGHDAISAWEIIATAHQNAFTRARANKRRWISWVWNAAVETDNAFTPPAHVDLDVARAVDAARSRLERLAWSMPPRQRPTLLLVGHTVLDRMLRTGQRRVPVPERDLVLDTGLADRKTIRAQLRALASTVGMLHTDALDPARRDASSFEFEIPTVQLGGVSQLPPPSSHTPYARAGLWRTLPAAAHQLWRALTSTAEPQPLEDLARTALLTCQPDEEPSPRQVRTTRAALTALAEAGLAHCTASGQWIARAALEPAHARRAEAHRAALEQTIAAERAAYRAPTGQWQVARAAALKANRAREVAWWTTLPAAERLRRRAAWQATFAALSVHDQEHLKAQLAARRVRAGVDEPHRHDQWLDNLSWDDYAHRSSERAAAFAALPSPMRQAKAAAWARHRDRYGISRGTPLAQSRREHAAALPDTRAGRDDAFWAAHLPLPHAPAADAS
jgi:hypothetical protein